MSRRAFGSRYRPGRGSILLAIFVVALMGWITLNTLRSDSPRRSHVSEPSARCLRGVSGVPQDAPAPTSEPLET